MQELKHKHILVNAEFLEKPPTVGDEELVENWMRRLVQAVNMKIVIEPRAHYVTKEGNEGITACTCIETSHAAMHVWDKTTPTMLRFDLYSCADFNPNTVIEMIKEFQPKKINYTVIDRDHEIHTTERAAFTIL